MRAGKVFNYLKVLALTLISVLKYNNLSFYD